MNNELMTIGERIQARRKELKLSYLVIATELGVSKTTIMRYCKGDIKKVPTESLIKLANILQTDINWLLGGSKVETKNIENLIPLNFKKFPLLGDIACGSPSSVDEIKEYILAPDSIEADFCLKANGDSMMNARIYDGDIVFIQKQSQVKNGEIAAVIIDNETTLKRVHFSEKENTLLLLPENSNFFPLIYRDEQLDKVMIIGKAVGFMAKI